MPISSSMMIIHPTWTLPLPFSSKRVQICEIRLSKITSVNVLYQ